MKNILLFIYRTNILVRLFTVNMKNCLTPQNPEMCDPILVTLLKLRPHYSQSSRENATPSSGTSPLVSYKEVPSIPPRGNSYIKVTGVLFVSLMSENCSLWSLLLSGQKANIQLNLHTATFLQRPIFGRNSIH